MCCCDSYEEKTTCKTHKRSCSDCGCEDWGKWKNTYSNSCSGDGKSAEC